MAEPDESAPLRARDVWIALAVTLLVVGGALAADPSSAVRRWVSQEVYCALPPLDARATNGWGGPHLNASESGVILTVTGAGEPRAFDAVIYKRDGSAAWREFHIDSVPDGKRTWFVAPIQPDTQVRIDIKDAEGAFCDTSVTITAGEEAAAPGPAAGAPGAVGTPSPEPTPAAFGSAPPADGCASPLGLEVTNGDGGWFLSVPETIVRVRAHGDEGLRPFAIAILQRDDGGDWRQILRALEEDGEGAWHIAPTSATSELRLEVVDLEGRHCPTEATMVAQPAA